MTTPDLAPRPAPSAEARQLIDAHQGACIAYGGYLCAINTADMAAQHDALSAYVAGLEAEVAASRAADAHTSGLPSGTYDQNDLRRAFKVGWAQSKLLNGTAVPARIGAEP